MQEPFSKNILLRDGVFQSIDMLDFLELFKLQFQLIFTSLYFLVFNCLIVHFHNAQVIIFSYINLQNINVNYHDY